MKLFNFLCVLIILISCSQKNKYNHKVKEIEKNDFPIVKTVVADTVLINDYNLNWKISVQDSLIVIQKNPFSLKPKNTFFSVYHKEKLNFLGGIGVKGEGPWHKEWSYIMQNGQISKKNNETLLWVYHKDYGFVAQLNITKTLYNDSPVPIIDTTMKVDANKFSFTNLIVSSDELVATPWMSDSPQSLIKSLNIDNKKVYKHPLSPIISNDKLLPSEVLNSFYTSNIKKLKNGKIVQAMKYFNRLNIFNDNLEIETVIVDKDGENWKDGFYDAKKIDIETNYLEGKMNGYKGVEVSDNFIFALKHKANDSNNSELRVFDLEGNPAFALYIKNPISFSLSFDKLTKTIYALDKVNDLVLKIDLTEFINKWKRSSK